MSDTSMGIVDDTPMVTVFDCETGESIVRPYTKEEIADMAERAQYAAQVEADRLAVEAKRQRLVELKDSSSTLDATQQAEAVGLLLDLS